MNYLLSEKFMEETGFDSAEASEWFGLWKLENEEHEKAMKKAQRK